MKKKRRVAVLFGGKSLEHEISIISGIQLCQAIDEECNELVPVYLSQEGAWYTGEALFDKKTYFSLNNVKQLCREITLLPKWDIGGFSSLPDLKTIPVDICFLAFHGTQGEDGCVQGLLELTGLPYTSCGVLASSLSMHKSACKSFVKDLGVPVLPSSEISWKNWKVDPDSSIKHILENAKFPLFVKPMHLGSSVGIGMACNEEQLQECLAGAFQYDHLALIEPCVSPLMEINVSVLPGDPPLVSCLEVPVAEKEALTYEDKYLKGGKKTGESFEEEGMASLTRVINPKDLSDSIKSMVIDSALRIFKALQAKGAVRFDFMLNTSTEQLYFNELNTIPGSMAFYLWEESNPPLTYTDMIDYLIEYTIQDHAEKQARMENFGFKALSNF